MNEETELTYSEEVDGVRHYQTLLKPIEKDLDSSNQVLIKKLKDLEKSFQDASFQKKKRTLSSKVIK